MVDDTLGNTDASHITRRAAADVSQGNIFDAFNDWQDHALWPALNKLTGKSGNVGGTTQKELKMQVDVQT